MKFHLLIYITTLAFLFISLNCSQPAIPTQQPAPAPAIETSHVDTTITIGAAANGLIRTLLGINIGPLPAGTDPRNADLTSAYKQVGINLIRTHDYYGPLDMSVMYPDRTRDPANAQSYNFTASDKAWRAIIDGGFEPYFRLGDSYNNSVPPANALERSNWTRAAVEVLRHYRTGKWGGFNTDFSYVEIWNEPDNQQFWPRPRTPLEYFQLYAEAATAIKQQFPGLNVGGPGLTPAGALIPQGKKWTQDFLEFARQKSAPLDFFSWHMYSNVPAQYSEAAKYYRAALDARGFSQTRLHITEWNTEIKRGSDNNAESIALRTGGTGAAILSAAWIELQQNEVEVSTFYRGPDPDIKAATFYGIFYADGNPKRMALAFSLWSKMVLYPQRLAISSSPGLSLWLLAGRNDAGKVALLVANTGDESIKTGIGFADRRQINKISLSQVNDASNQVQTISLTNPVFETGANTVQFLIMD
jgi:xylan 1,4-beta-xylosidase